MAAVEIKTQLNGPYKVTGSQRAVAEARVSESAVAESDLSRRAVAETAES
jgi:hypothetical protein